MPQTTHAAGVFLLAGACATVGPTDVDALVDYLTFMRQRKIKLP